MKEGRGKPFQETAIKICGKEKIRNRGYLMIPLRVGVKTLQLFAQIRNGKSCANNIF